MGNNGKISASDEVANKARRRSTLLSLKLKRKLRIKQIKDEAAQAIKEVNIRYAEDPDRLRAKYASDEYAKNERARLRAARLIAREKKLNALVQKLRPYTTGEEIMSSIICGLGVVFFIAATVLLDVLALNRLNTSYKTVYFVVYTLFGCLMIANFLFSTLHHAITNLVAKEVFKRLCHAGVFVIIAVGFISYSLLPLATGNKIVWILNIAAITLCFVGFLMYCISGTYFETANIVFYGVLGAAGFIISLFIFKTVTSISFWWLLFSGIIFILGLIFCALRKIPFMHSIGNLLLLAASVALFISFFYIQ